VGWGRPLFVGRTEVSTGLVLGSSSSYLPAEAWPRSRPMVGPHRPHLAPTPLPPGHCAGGIAGPTGRADQQSRAVFPEYVRQTPACSGSGEPGI